jgi:hypothetical protein
VSCLLLFLRPGLLLHAAPSVRQSTQLTEGLCSINAVRLDRRSEWQSQELDDFIAARSWRLKRKNGEWEAGWLR